MSSRSLSLLSLPVALLLGCGDAGSPTGPDPFSQPRVPPVLTPLPGFTFTVPAGGSVKFDFDGPVAGYMVATVDWQDPANKVMAAFTGRGCHTVNDAIAGPCDDPDVYGSRATCDAKPQGLSAHYYRPAALRLWIANAGSTADAGSVTLIHCTDAPNCGASASCAQCISWALQRRSCGEERRVERRGRLERALARVRDQTEP